ELVIKSTNTQAQSYTSVPKLETQSQQLVHTVAMKETLFSISRQYNISVQQLKEWNGLSSEELNIGQLLFVSQPVYSVGIQQESPVVEPTPQNQTQTIAQPQDPSSVIIISESVKDKDEVKEAGLAELIEGTEGNRKYLALHRTLPVGTIIKVRNEMNNREVFVRIVGQLPDTALTNKLIIKISKSAYDRLGAIDPRFRVEVTYYK
ncbi:MAG: LysM peptidoglycan-binding domain-containing protein, partial [Cyclobacteriaceae bacterium]|nr:LysM peptidoglycan-binding domain-containing protein [Cyclobacteriaceae bacterium]